MLKNYLKIAWRTILKNKLFSAINILGLSIGIALCFVIMLYVQDELSYDRFHNHADRIARVIFQASINGGKINESVIMPPVAEAMKKDFPEVQDATRIMRYGTAKITYGNQSFKDDEFAFVDPNFLTVFTLPLVAGDAKTALSQPHTVIITQETAKKYFGQADPLGKMLHVANTNQFYKVTGVMENIPANSHFHFDIFASMTGWEPAKSTSWMESSFHTYLLLRPDADYEQLQSKFPAMVAKYMGPEIQQTMGLSLEQFRSKGNQLGFALQPLTAIHLHPETSNEFEAGGNESYVYIFAGIALFMLLVACINFVNLSTAIATKRAKEVGIRKVSGSDRLQLIRQFLAESLVLTFFSLILALAFIQLTLPTFNALSGKELHFDTKPLLVFVGLGLAVGVLAGMYPAFYLSSFEPLSVLKGRLTRSSKNVSLRSGLVVFQFFVSIGLIVSTIVVYQQMRFIQNKNLGYNREQLLTLPNSYALGKNEQVYKNQILQDARVVNATVSWYKPAGPTSYNNALAYPKGHDDQLVSAVEYHVDEQYIPTLGMQLATGRNFSKTFATDSLGIILNESALKAFGWNLSDAVGQTIIRQNSSRGNNIPFHVIGVVKDFHFKSLHEAITPLFLTYHPEGGLIFKIKTPDVNGLLADMKQKWDAYATEEPFTYTFMDDLYNKTYAAEQKTGTILTIFSVLTIFVACLGLFGLATYTAEQRTKEIGIRKVLGASEKQLITLLSQDFVKLVSIAFVIATPVAWYFMSQWLQNFAFRIELHWWMFAGAGALSLAIALLTVSFQAIKAAVANPVKSLRSE
jgi:putative ABC transport system permease protein